MSSGEASGTGKKTKIHTFATEDEAFAAIPKLRREYRRPLGVPLSQALEAYAGYLTIVRQNRPGTIEIAGLVVVAARRPAQSRVHCQKDAVAFDFKARQDDTLLTALQKLLRTNPVAASRMPYAENDACVLTAP